MTILYFINLIYIIVMVFAIFLIKIIDTQQKDCDTVCAMWAFFSGSIIILINFGIIIGKMFGI